MAGVPVYVYLVGMPGAGKSTVGRSSPGSSMPFVDLDDKIELEAGAAVTDIFRDEGEAAFRGRWKAAALVKASMQDRGRLRRRRRARRSAGRCSTNRRVAPARRAGCPSGRRGARAIEPLVTAGPGRTPCRRRPRPREGNRRRRLGPGAPMTAFAASSARTSASSSHPPGRSPAMALFAVTTFVIFRFGLDQSRGRARGRRVGRDPAVRGLLAINWLFVAGSRGGRPTWSVSADRPQVLFAARGERSRST